MGKGMVAICCHMGKKDLLALGAGILKNYLNIDIRGKCSMDNWVTQF